MNHGPMSRAEAVRVRAAAMEDLPALLELYRTLNPGDPALGRQAAQGLFAAMLAQPGLSIFVGLDEDRPVSTATLSVIPNLTRGGQPYGLIENVVTLVEQQGKGYGRAVVNHAVQAAFAADCYKVMLLTGRTREAVHRFYESCGFIQNKTGFQIRND